MTAECQQLRLALGLSAGVNVLLFFCIAWSMAVNRGQSREPRGLSRP